MNRHFAYVRKWGIMEVVHDPQYGRLVYDFLTVAQTKELLASTRVIVDNDDGIKIVPVFNIWFDHADRR